MFESFSSFLSSTGWFVSNFRQFVSHFLQTSCIFVATIHAGQNWAELLLPGGQKLSPSRQLCSQSLWTVGISGTALRKLDKKRIVRAQGENRSNTSFKKSKTSTVHTAKRLFVKQMRNRKCCANTSTKLELVKKSDRERNKLQKILRHNTAEIVCKTELFRKKLTSLECAAILLP